MTEETRPARNLPTRCANCRFWVVAKDNKSPETSGECRRYPPETHFAEGEFAIFFPATDALDWCGEYAVRHDS